MCVKMTMDIADAIDNNNVSHTACHFDNGLVIKCEPL